MAARSRAAESATDREASGKPGVRSPHCQMFGPPYHPVRERASTVTFARRHDGADSMNYAGLPAVAPIPSNPHRHQRWVPARGPHPAPAFLLFLVGTVFLLPRALDAQSFVEDFDSYSNGPLDGQNAPNQRYWSATNSPPAVVTVQGASPNYFAQATISSLAPVEFMKPWVWDSAMSNWKKASWTVNRTGGQFLRVEFDATATGAIGSSGRMIVMFDSKPNNGPADNNTGFGDAGPLFAVEFDEAIAATYPLQASIWVQDASGLKQHGPSSLNIPLGPTGFTPQSLRVDFAWDYFMLPREFGSNGVSGPPSQGEPWFYIRPWYKDSSGTWTEAYSRPGHSNGETDGWVEFGNEAMNTTIPPPQFGSQKIGVYRYDWVSGTWPNATYDPVYVYWYFDDAGTGNALTWTIDNVAIGPVAPPPFAIMTSNSATIPLDRSGRRSA